MILGGIRARVVSVRTSITIGEDTVHVVAGRGADEVSAGGTFKRYRGQERMIGDSEIP